MIDQRDRLATTPERELALDCIEAAIDAAAPETTTRGAVALDGETLTVGETTCDLAGFEDVLVVGGGKAGGGVTRALESVLGDRLTGGVVVTKQPAAFERVRNVVGDHPLPTERTVAATAEMLDLVRDADETTLVLFVLTGGASSLLTAPAEGLTVDDLRTTTERLLAGGVPIESINAVRKHCSALKGGQVARLAAPATVVGILLSDVVGNDLSTIGSGPTVPDPTTYADALAVFDRGDIDPPTAVRDHLEAGVDGRVPETPFPDDPVFEHTTNVLVGDNGVALDAARTVAAASDYTPIVLTSRLRGEASEIARSVVAIGEEVVASGNPVEPPAVVLAGGECTVSVTGDGGEGGPNQEFALSAGLELSDDSVVAAVDTDGEDGSSDVAGAIVDATTVSDPAEARAALDCNEAGTYLSERGATIRTGPTGTNVNDVVVMVVPRRPHGNG